MFADVKTNHPSLAGLDNQLDIQILNVFIAHVHHITDSEGSRRFATLNGMHGMIRFQQVESESNNRELCGKLHETPKHLTAFTLSSSRNLPFVHFEETNQLIADLPKRGIVASNEPISFSPSASWLL